MLLLTNIFPINTRKHTYNLFSQNHVSTMFKYSNNFSSFENQKRSRKKLCYMKSEKIGHHQQYCQLKAITNVAATTMEDEKEIIIAQKGNNGIGIVDFFEGKNILVTGGTGFLAKALIEKMLRTTPKVNKIYLLIRAKDKEAAFHRLKIEIMESELFKCLEEMHGESYKSFIENKLIPIVGNIYEPNLGMDIITSDKIAQEIDLIVDSAAITTFDERYDLALDTNVNGPYQLMMFTKKCKNLKLLMHYSTAYANGEREGLILEKPFIMEESITKEKITSISPFTNFPSLHVDNEIDLVSKLKNNIINNIDLEQIMKNLGVERAKLYGWQDTYTFTKAIGEMMINNMRHEIPVLIIRPSIITSSYKEPFPGWMQGFRTIDPLIFFYRKGDLPCLLGDPNCLVDLVPVDMVVNATMAAMAKHGNLQNSQLNVYHVASSSINPVSFSQIFDYSYNYFKLFPFVNKKGDKFDVKQMRYFDKILDVENYIWEVLSKQHEVQDGKELTKIQIRLIEKKVEYLKNFSKLYEPYLFYKGWFDNDNTRKLMGDMSEEEKRSFEIDVTKINWRNYIEKIHILGVQKYVLEGNRIN
ncbi:fatty acyl-CoA reductase 2, chloroplastic-like [Solanum stenotomum]|uniref:fatty acyl-CoA reductase 2, chloroplastic-like n=1 Tax=Solanum stenotomum TaxID=172797 RepID=UPI0020D0B28E|nr:fatty acyl-CoA reductase 2, chloroplastic-like [Solanum stenotomum]